MADPAFDSVDYELLWPGNLFVRELTAVHTAGWASAAGTTATSPPTSAGHYTGGRSTRWFLKTALFRDDEDALFRIANKFAIRHQDTKQRTDYDPMFLDWIFWCYLFTIELSDRLLARQAAQTSPATP